MKIFPFLDERPDEENFFLITISYGEIVRSAVKGGIIKDDELTKIAEVLPLLFKLSAQLRDDLYEHHHTINKNLQMPIVNNCFCYAFAKGAESAFLFNQKKDSKTQFDYSKEDALNGVAGAQVSEDFAKLISVGMLLMYNVFCDFQDNVINKSKLIIKGGRLMADVIACGFFWASQVGVDFGMDKLGFR